MVLKKQIKMFNLIIAILFISIHISHSTNAQGSLTKIEGNYTGVLNFFNTPTTTTPTIKHPLPQFSGLRSNQTEGLNASEGWYVEKNTKVRGFIKEAYLAVSWGILLGEIVENYNFQWKSTGKYEIEFYDREGKFQKLFITREKLQKYPDLLKRFDYIQPTNISFEIDWASSNLDNDKKNSFKSEYNITGDIGSSSVGYVKDGHRTTVPSHMQLFFPSGQEPLSVPSIRQTGWKGFMGLPDNFSEDKLRAMKKYFSIANEQSISSFRATENKWPLGEFKAIAEAFLRYESGEGLPKSPGELVDSLSTSANQYDKTDEWSEPYTEPFNIKFEGGSDVMEAYSEDLSQTSKNTSQGLEIKGIVDGEGKLITKGNFSLNGKTYPFNLTYGSFKMVLAPHLLTIGKNDILVTIGSQQKKFTVFYKEGSGVKSCKIGNQIWMAQNLNVDRFRNGDPIPEARSNEEWESAGKNGKPAWCYYENDPANGTKYGKLYNWHAVNDPRGLAPKGWHVPTINEWHDMAKWLQSNDEWVIGPLLKSKSGWKEKNGKDKYGFSALPGGHRIGWFQLRKGHGWVGLENRNGEFLGVQTYCSWWSSSVQNEYTANNITYLHAHYFFLDQDDESFDLFEDFPEFGHSVRCLKD
jgi:uncharacterized protein (TIGR02145 family)